VTDEPILDYNDQALIGMFLREMLRFEKFVRAQGTEHVIARIGAAYNQALIKFAQRQQGSK
jgi:hypothetical protein